MLHRSLCQNYHQTVYAMLHRSLCQNYHQTVYAMLHQSLCQNYHQTVYAMLHRSLCQNYHQTVYAMLHRSLCQNYRQTVYAMLHRSLCQNYHQTVYAMLHRSLCQNYLRLKSETTYRRVKHSEWTVLIGVRLSENSRWWMAKLAFSILGSFFLEFLFSSFYITWIKSLHNGVKCFLSMRRLWARFCLNKLESLFHLYIIYFIILSTSTVFLNWINRRWGMYFSCTQKEIISQTD